MGRSIPFSLGEFLIEGPPLADSLRSPRPSWRPLSSPSEVQHRTIFINKSALDYIVMPTHRYDEGRTEIDAQDLDILDTPGRSERGQAKSKGGK